ncbi:MAG TPA: peptide chain release factor N(5)-glutamine methyltransferase, partial [Pyrinomonadaceae bacterium]|nr:peptide chain release factor N(5)-glutamine methyltransferase [Pyrinomonadaceae bacterium]
LLARALQKDKTFLYAHPEASLSDDEKALFESHLSRRAAREPFQYITGVQEFYGLEFEVTPDVLIPRPETEMVVEEALAILKDEETPSFCEIGVGSGCISVSILHGLPRARAVSVDVSSAAIAVARRNAKRHGVGERLELIESDVFERLSNKTFRVIVSNPPYVPVSDFAGLQPEVRDFEPHNALTDGSDGLSIIRRIIDDSPRFLGPRGRLLMEIGFDQSEKVATMFDLAIWSTPDLVPDLQGIPRLVSARLK